MHEQRNYTERARRIIDQVFASTRSTEKNEKVIRRALHEAYPFSRRAGHAYRVWLGEVRARCAREGIPWRKRSTPREQLALFRL